MVKVVDKLIRDKDIDTLVSRGAVFHVADDEEYRMKLKDSVLEEAKEFHSSGNVEKIADILEVIEMLVASHGLRMDDIQKIRDEINRKSGSFKRKLVLDSLEN